MSWIGVGIAIAGAALGAYNAQQTAKKQDRALAAQITQQGKKQQQASAKISEALAAQAQSDPADEQAQQMESYLSTLRQGQQNAGLNTGPGGFSEEYRRGTAEAGEQLGEYGTGRADLLSRIDAPRLQRQNEGIMFDTLGNELRMIGSEASGQAYLDQLRYNSIQQDPWLDALGSVATSYGKGMAGSGPTGASGSPSGGAISGAPSSLLGLQASTGPGSIYNFGNNVDNLWGWSY